MFSQLSFHHLVKFFQVYARFRANSVQKTLQALRDHLRNSNVTGFQANSPVAPSSGISPLAVRNFKQLTNYFIHN